MTSLVITWLHFAANRNVVNWLNTLRSENFKTEHICSVIHICLLSLTDWVIQLGPPTVKGYFYQYSVVTDNSDLNLFVLARNVTEFKQNYETEVLSKLKSQGFTKVYNKPREIYQEADCVYVEPNWSSLLI